MSQSLSSFGVSLPLCCGKSRISTKLLSSGCNLPFLTPASRVCNGFSVKAMRGERDSLDHLQRVTAQQRKPSYRTSQASPVGLWDRFPAANTVQQMMETMARMMEEEELPSGGRLRSQYGRGRRKPWEMKEVEGEYRMRIDMPGMTKSDVKVWVEEKMLVLKAEKVEKKKNGGGGGGGGGEEAEEEEEEEEEWGAKSYGSYYSRIALPENVEFEKIRAEVRDGVLYITIPKARASSKILDISVQ